MNLNCKTCGTGRRHWFPLPQGQWECSTCKGDPLVENSGRADWEDYRRAKMVAMFGPRMPGDMELVRKYANELHGYDRAVPLESLGESLCS